MRALLLLTVACAGLVTLAGDAPAGAATPAVEEYTLDLPGSGAQRNPGAVPGAPEDAVAETEGRGAPAILADAVGSGAALALIAILAAIGVAGAGSAVRRRQATSTVDGH
jgi:hypothetical protein